MADFTHLHVHSEFSLLDGLSTIKQITETVSGYGMSGVALTDHGSMYGVPKFYWEAKKAGIKPIIGVEVYLSPRSRKLKVPKLDDVRYHLVLLAKNRQGYQNLMRLVSLSNIDGFYYKPRVDKDLLQMYHEGVIASSACLGGEIPRLIMAGRDADAQKAALWYEETFGKGNFFLEIQPNELPEQKKVNKKIIELSEATGIPVIVTTDAHYPNKSDAEAHDILIAINTKKTVDSDERLSMLGLPAYLWSEEEIRSAVPNADEAIKNTKMIQDLCEVEIENHDWVLPKAAIPDEYEGSADKYLYNLTFQRCKKRLNRELTEEESKRLEYELGIIAQTGFSSYMLMTSEFSDWMIDREIPFTTRGSAAGSFVAYSIGIVNANPLNFNLPFERFLNPLRPKAPDIDLDVASSVREKLVKFTVERHGKENVAHIATFGKMLERGAVRDAGRVLGLPLDYVDRIAKLIPSSGQGLKKKSIAFAIENVAEVRELLDKDPDARKLIEAAQKIEGRARNVGLHACGILVTPTPIIDYVPVFIDSKTDRMVTQYTMDVIEDLKLIKVDFLGLTGLDTIRETIKLVSKSKDEKIDLENLALDDEKVYATIKNCDTLGIFQLESDVMKNTIRTIKPSDIFDLSAVNALVRPGPNQYQKEYAMRKSGQKPVEYLDPRMESFLKNSYGVLVYQEDIIRTVIEIGGMDWGEADRVRKLTGKKKPELLFEMKDELIQRFVDHGLSEEKANQLFELFIPFTNYAFNQAHATAYGLIAYYTAWLKTHYRIEFMGALLKTEIDNKDMIRKVLEECYQKKIKILPPSINESDVDYSIENGDSVRIGLGAIKGISRKSVRQIVDKRNELGTKFESLDHLLYVSDLQQVPYKTFELLIQAGALDTFGDRNAILSILEQMYKKFKDQQDKLRLGQKGLFVQTSSDATVNASYKPIKTELPSSITASDSEKLQWEMDLIGIYVTDHPLQYSQGFKEKFGIKGIVELTPNTIGQTVLVLGKISRIKKITTKNGDPMAFITLEDLDGDMEVVVFPRVMEKLDKTLAEGCLVVVKGRVNTRAGRDDETLSIIAEKIKKVSEKDIKKHSVQIKSTDVPDKADISQSKVGPVADFSAVVTVKTDGIQCIMDNGKIWFNISRTAGKDALLKLKTAMIKNQGDLEVALKIEDGNGGRIVKSKCGVREGEWLQEWL